MGLIGRGQGDCRAVWGDVEKLVFVGEYRVLYIKKNEQNKQQYLYV